MGDPSAKVGFKKYGGAASPRTLPPERFPMVQGAILTELEELCESY